MQLEQPVRLIHGGHGLVRRQIQHHGIELVGDAQRLDLLDKPGCILGAGQLLLKGMQAEAVVDALVEDTAQLAVALKDQDILHTALAGRHRRRKPCRAAADDDQINIFH